MRLWPFKEESRLVILGKLPVQWLCSYCRCVNVSQNVEANQLPICKSICKYIIDFHTSESVIYYDTFFLWNCHIKQFIIQYGKTIKKKKFWFPGIWLAWFQVTYGIMILCIKKPFMRNTVNTSQHGSQFIIASYTRQFYKVKFSSRSHRFVFFTHTNIL